jgi:hypothetical protein
MAMTKYNEDLLYAKKIVAIRDACIENRMGNTILSTSAGGEIKYEYSKTSHNIHFFILGSKTSNDGVFTNSFYTTNKTANHLFVSENYAPHEFELNGNYSEEYYFQNSLIYSDSVNTRVLIANYIKAHPDCTDYNSMQFSVFYAEYYLYKIYLENGNDEIR